MVWKVKKLFGTNKYYLLNGSLRYGDEKNSQFRVRFFSSRLKALRFAKKLNKNKIEWH